VCVCVWSQSGLRKSKTNFAWQAGFSVCVCGDLEKVNKLCQVASGTFSCVCADLEKISKHTDFLSRRTHSKYTILEDTQCLPIFECVGYTIL
jgi:hypothetical protein